jgi:hypothetical protein
MSALQIIDSSGWYMISTNTSKNFYDRVQELCADMSDNVVIYRTAYYYPEPWKITDGSFNASNWFQVTDINLPNLYQMSPSLGYWVLILEYTAAADYYKNDPNTPYYQGTPTDGANGIFTTYYVRLGDYSSTEAAKSYNPPFLISNQTGDSFKHIDNLTLNTNTLYEFTIDASGVTDLSGHAHKFNIKVTNSADEDNVKLDGLTAGIDASGESIYLRGLTAMDGSMNIYCMAHESEMNYDITFDSTNYRASAQGY